MLLQIFLQYATEVIPRNSEAWIPLAMLAVSAGTAAYSGYQKAQASKQLRSSQESVLNRQKSLTDHYNLESNRDFFTTDMAKGAVDRITKNLRSANKKTADNNASSGSTQEAKVATKAANLGKYNEAISSIAGYGARYKDNMNQRYAGSLAGLYAGNSGVYGKDVDSWGNLQSNSFNSMSSALNALDVDKKKGDVPNADDGGES